MPTILGPACPAFFYLPMVFPALSQGETSLRKNWIAGELEKRYQLKDFGGGTFAYELKESEANGEPIHRLCPTCFQDGKKHILQPRGGNAYKQDMFHCDGCGHTFVFGHRQSPDIHRQRPMYRRI